MGSLEGRFKQIHVGYKKVKDIDSPRDWSQSQEVRALILRILGFGTASRDNF